ncbi:MAG: segregation and condensation protein [Clostridiales bacterium]|jgi:segregation and condensation protein A|nr:segregation and condensation protein [Clostridiales bacterium]
MGIDVKLSAFEGPLDLLLYLITKDEVDIYDIPIVSITTQYFEAISGLREVDMELSSEFLVMAATLLEIKSRMLLPEKSGEEGAGEEMPDDPREELVNRLLTYKQFKEASTFLKSREGALDNVVFKEQEELSDYAKKVPLDTAMELDLLTEAIQRVLEKIDRFDVGREGYFSKVKRDRFTVDEKIAYIESVLTHQHHISFSALFAEVYYKEEVIVTFLALLELIKLKRISLRQTQTFGEMNISAINA